MAADDLDSLASAWLTAAADLDIEVTAPFAVDDKGDFVCIAWIAHFGSPRGTVIVGDSAIAQVRAAAAAQDVYYSVVSESAYGHYDRDLFIGTLNDWGWQGDPAHAPDWYTGEPWR